MKRTRTHKEADWRIDQWHSGGNKNTMPLHEYLGWTLDEYAFYVETGKIPRKEKLSLLEQFRRASLRLENKKFRALKQIYG